MSTSRHVCHFYLFLLFTQLNNNLTFQLQTMQTYKLRLTEISVSHTKSTFAQKSMVHLRHSNFQLPKKKRIDQLWQFNWHLEFLTIKKRKRILNTWYKNHLPVLDIRIKLSTYLSHLRKRLSRWFSTRNFHTFSTILYWHLRAP